MTGPGSEESSGGRAPWAGVLEWVQVSLIQNTHKSDTLSYLQSLQAASSVSLIVLRL